MPAAAHRIRLAASLALLFGIALFAALVLHYGFAEVAAATAAIGWNIAWIVLIGVAILAVDTAGWAALMPPANRPGLWRLTWIRWICMSVNRLLPVAQVGGDVVRARLLTRYGVAGGVAGAGVIVDVTVGVLTLAAFAATGLLLLVVDGGATDIAGQVAVGLLIFGLLIAGFVAVQRSGLLRRMADALQGRFGATGWSAVAGHADLMHRTIAAIYADRRAVAVSFFWRYLGWCLGAVEVWLILKLLGHPVSLFDAFVIEAIAQAVIAAGFAIPGALGVQEGGLVAIGLVFDIAPEVALAVSLIKRGRDLLLGLPGLALWQTVEGRWLWLRRNQTTYCR